MSKQGVLFDRGSAERIGDVVREVERQSPGVPARSRQIARTLIAKFVVVAVLNDYLSCRRLYPTDGTEGNEDVAVAKPFELRRTPFDGEQIVYINGQAITYVYVDQRERSATDRVDTETQVMKPDYWIGCEITAVSIDTGIVDNEDIPIRWEDQNTAGRHWATED